MAAAPTEAKTGARLAGQSSFAAIAAAEPASKTSNCGFSNTPVTPNWLRPGPTARIKSCTVPDPLRANPAMRMFAPVPTRLRAERLINRAVPAGAGS